jgi:hypothetical protein
LREGDWHAPVPVPRWHQALFFHLAPLSTVDHSVAPRQLNRAPLRR